MTSNTDVHTCSYYCERPECIKRQRDELRDWMESVGDRMESELAQQPAGVMPDGISDDVIKAVWRAAMTSAHNVCVNRSNRWNDDDGPDDRITEANECAKEIAHWLEADEGFIAEIRAALAAQQGGRDHG